MSFHPSTDRKVQIVQIPSEQDRSHLAVAVAAAKAGLAEGGIPIGAALIVDDRILATGWNKRVQQGSAIRHGETDCLENAGRLTAAVYAKATMVTTLSPCDMCTGAILLYKIPRVIIGENRTFYGGEDYLRSRGVEVIVLDDPECSQMMTDFIAAEPTLWNEDIGVPD
jgi:cytosine/creatinine deaminase